MPIGLDPLNTCTCFLPTEVLPKDDERSLRFVAAERARHLYPQSPRTRTPYEVDNCPDHPPEGYPMQWPVLDVLKNWPADDPSPPAGGIAQGICVFDYRTERHKAERYQKKEVPFIMRDDPAVARTAERWLHPDYMEKLLMGNEDTQRRTEYSPNNVSGVVCGAHVARPPIFPTALHALLSMDQRADSHVAAMLIDAI